MKPALRLFALLFSCSTALGGTITAPSWTAAQLQPGEGALFATAGPDGNIWASEQGKGQILRINPTDGSVTRYPLPANTIPLQITFGPDGNLWFSGGQLQGGSPVSIIGRVTQAGTYTIFNYPVANAFTLLSSGPIAGSPDGNVYVANPTSKRIGIISAAASTSSLVLTEASLPFDFVGIPIIAPRQAGGIYVCGQSAKYCGALIGGRPNLISLPTTERPTGVSECGSSACVATSGGIGSNSLWKISYPEHIIGPFPYVLSNSFQIGKISCTDRLCLGAAGSTLAAMDLTSDPPTSYSVGSPPGVNVTDVRLFLPPQGGLNIIAIGENPATRDSNVFISGNVIASTCVPPVTFLHGPTLITTWRLGDLSLLFLSVQDAVPPVTYSQTGGAMPPGFSLGTGNVGGQPGTTGTYTFTLTATDARGCKASQTITIVVLDPRSSTSYLEEAVAILFGRD
jgi:streptogramin lyase